MECPSHAVDPSDVYPGALEFAAAACDITNSTCGSATLCLVCLTPVDGPHLENSNKLLQHSGVAMVTRLQQLLPLSVDVPGLPSVCAACVSLVVSIDELELQLSERHCQLQRRHVHRAGQQEWQRAAEQVICSSVQEVHEPCHEAGRDIDGLCDRSTVPEMQDPCSAARELEDSCEVGSAQHPGLITDMSEDSEKAETHADYVLDAPLVGQKDVGDIQQGRVSCNEVGGYHEREQDKPQSELMFESQEEDRKPLERSLNHPAGIEAVPNANFLETNTETGGRPVRTTRNVKPRKYASTPEDSQADPDELSAPSAPLAAAAGDAGSAARRRAELQRRCLASLSVDRGDERPYQCRVCERRLRDRTTALRHVLSHIAERPYVCAVCSRGFVRRSHLQAHMCQHAERRLFACDCGHAAVSPAALAAHRKTHTTAKPVRCSQCDKRFRKRSDLVIHQRAHTGERPFQCDLCERAFASASSLNAHARKHLPATADDDSSGDGGGLRCERCAKTFEDAESLESHRLTHDTKPFCCDQCGVQFTRASTLRRHQTRHVSGAAAHRCEVCRRTFRLASALRDHVRVHTGERPFACGVCDKRFSLQSTLTTHMRLHTGERPFQCEICPRSFAQATPLKRHMKTHRTEQPPQPPPPSLLHQPPPVSPHPQQHSLSAQQPQPQLQPQPQPPTEEDGLATTTATAVVEQSVPLPPPPPLSSSSQQQAQPSASLVTVMASFTPMPDDRGDDVDRDCSGGGGGATLSAGIAVVSEANDAGSVSDVGGGGGGGGGELYHELQPLSPHEPLRFPLYAVGIATKEEADQHLKRHLARLGQPGKPPQSEPVAQDWQ